VRPVEAAVGVAWVLEITDGVVPVGGATVASVEAPGVPVGEVAPEVAVAPDGMAPEVGDDAPVDEPVGTFVVTVAVAVVAVVGVDEVGKVHDWLLTPHAASVSHPVPPVPGARHQVQFGEALHVEQVPKVEHNGQIVSATEAPGQTVVLVRHEPMPLAWPQYWHPAAARHEGQLVLAVQGSTFEQFAITWLGALQVETPTA